MSEIKKCENCGNENIEIINRYKGHYLCGKCGRDTEKLYEIEHDAEIRAKAIEEFADRLKDSLVNNYRHLLTVDADGFEWLTTDAVDTHIDKIAEEMRGAK